MSDHATHSSHVTDHFLSTLLSLSYMRCVACCWKSHLTPAVLCWKARPLGTAASCHMATGRRRAARRAERRAACPPAYPGRTHLQIVSYRIAIFCLISYRIYRFLLRLYRAITRVNMIALQYTVAPELESQIIALKSCKIMPRI